ncbi:hypothetical protein BSQ39_08155 [Loigolactobacillus backii]|uniref:Uncharacterized protein n=1 Tax=Loigolactobacillus backii TaxID=375175 RepID=A0A192H4A3_9LACO|nr:hypothetical protein [Loigolactobacillus backii]ANK62801.1 hypothetical protein AYR53_08575 [Loigolactobacillus backii]ANK70191.1 hypothetical protein AYR56_08430 [Loigolactobacillus backii]PIO83538.1 hypothetical protein BSQ39_08155 [Loigolactobacillus backii]
MKKTKILSRIEAAKKAHELIEVHVKKQVDDFEVGFPIASDHRWLIIAAINTEGQFDGFTLFALKRIKKIKVGTAYLTIVHHYIDFAKAHQLYDPLKLADRQKQIKHWERNLSRQLLILLAKKRAFVTIGGRFKIIPTGRILAASAHGFTFQPFYEFNYTVADPLIISLKDIAFIQFWDIYDDLYQYTAPKIAKKTFQIQTKTD